MLDYLVAVEEAQLDEFEILWFFQDAVAIPRSVLATVPAVPEYELGAPVAEAALEITPPYAQRRMLHAFSNLQAYSIMHTHDPSSMMLVSDI